MKNTLAIFLAFGLAAVSCKDMVVTGPQTIPLVREIISDKSLPEHTKMAQYTRNRSYSIYLIGEPRECRRYSSALVSYDHHDNVNGNVLADGLPDFAGETIISLEDWLNFPYSGIIDKYNSDSLKVLTLLNCINALDTLCHLSPYDQDGLGKRMPAKLIVLTSSYSESYGLFDVDSLFAAFGCRVPVVNPYHEMLSAARRASGSPCIGVIASEQMLSSGIYADCIAFPRNPEPGADQLISFLDKYMAAGYTKPLTAILVDDPDVTSSELNLTLERILSVMNEESYTYSRIISSDFCIIDPESVLAAECFRIMRKENLFTHHIAYPKEERLMNVISSDSLGYIIPFNEKFLHTDVQTDSTARGDR